MKNTIKKEIGSLEIINELNGKKVTCPRLFKRKKTSIYISKMANRAIG